MECEITSSENVRPSSPTPQNLRTYRFSMIDQLLPSALVPVILFFPNTTTEIGDPNMFISETTQQLKRSLSIILTRFYPLAGRVNSDGQSIDCNDEGVPFVVAKFTGHKLSELLRINPDQTLLCCLVPNCEITSSAEYGPDSIVALIQVNYFDCGGIAVGAVFSHKVADAMTMATFLKSWAATTRNSNEAVCPNYFVQSMFRPCNEDQLFPCMDNVHESVKTVTRRYVFDASAISSLKSKSGVERPTRVGVVSALFWKCFMAASVAGNISASVMAQAVDLRKRARPPFPSDCFGNIAWIAVATTSSTENENELGELVRKMRDALSKVDNEYIDRFRGDEGLSDHDQNFQLLLGYVPKDANLITVSSWCNSGLYGIDFGWGKPSWIARSDMSINLNLPLSCFVWLMDTRSGGGIEAWVRLYEKYLTVFDNVEELRALAIIDPSPLDIPTTI